MNWVYNYEKTITTIFYIREKNKYPEKFICPLSLKDVTKDICHSVETCLECHNKYYPGNRDKSWDKINNNQESRKKFFITNRKKLNPSLYDNNIVRRRI